ncbi:hypothetical protein IMZ11_02330 [Microtetraspora sp. AC03309]|uniref:DUF6093 family protein n=1 Tax=Microtetraspora sp. AC03309 TaxID=2779376 RepID=UPI001E3A65F3|nr:DUF6093 family protein [Microtetraspora sp. AC03309]MCC5574478.1 hypothetical protein [Microtetraspora sp. AC03309]
MSVASALARGRTAALQLMVDSCRIERKTGSSFNEASGAVTEMWVEVYAGRCRVKGGSSGRDAQYGEGEVTLHRYEVRIPWDAVAEIKRCDRLTITASDDAWVIGRHLEVIDVTYTGTSTARKISAEDRT